MSSTGDSLINVQEHYYDDDPKVGHPDVRTELRDVDYYFLGNGLIQAAVQVAPAGDGTPLGLVVMNPDRLRKKREALTMDPAAGVGATLLTVTRDGRTSRPRAGRVRAAWAESAPIPTVVAGWQAGSFAVEESFSCPRWSRAALVREVKLRHTGRTTVVVDVATGVRDASIRRTVRLRGGGTTRLFIEYTLDRTADRVACRFIARPPIDGATRRFWSGLAELSFGHPLLDRFFRVSKWQLPVAVSRRGMMDGSIWQYNREWLRDQAMVALALTMIGAHRLAGTMFRRLLDEFVTGEGDTVDSSERRAPSEVELDQNGILLYTLKEHILWTGDTALIETHWAKIVATAEFPLRPIFRHGPSGLLMNRREFWERHRAHGIETGLELVHQLYAVHGLAAAAVLARLAGHPAEAGRWEAESARLKTAMLDDPQFRLVDARGFIKRRSPEGPVQETVVAQPDAGLPAESPLARPGRHFLNPDTSAALPFVLGVVSPDSPLCRATLDTLETLWNQDWTGGGYGRYHATSEADSPGGWPFPSLFVARACVEAGDHRRAWRVLNWLGRARGARAGAWFEFYGRRLAPPFPQVGIVPWNWAEMIFLLVHHVLGVRPDTDGVRVRPRLLAGVQRAAADFPVRGRRLKLQVARSTRQGWRKLRSSSRVLALEGEAALVSYR
jgi:hypothetical protein